MQKKVISGAAHRNCKGKEIPDKNPRYEPCNCRFKCTELITEEHQRSIFVEYRTISTRMEQRAFLSRLMVEHTVKRRRVDVKDCQSLRMRSIAYTLKDAEGTFVRVCLSFFCKTFAISQSVTKNIANNINPTTGRFDATHGSVGRTPWNATTNRCRRQVVSFLRSVPKMPSHYCRKRTQRLYFEPGLNLTRLYELYKEKVPAGAEEPVSLFVFSKLFHEFEPELAFFKPKKDQCTLCNIRTEGKYEEHIARKEAIKKAKEEDKKSALADRDRLVYATFDLQALLTLPYCEDSQLYFSRKLSCMNFTIYDSLGNGLCHVWDETEGSKGCEEISTCILDYLNFLPSTIERVIFYCDTCGGQNRNKFLVGSLLIAVNSDQFTSNISTIDIKYLESGHSMMECDSIHAAVERQRKYAKVFIPEEYWLLIRMARHNPGPVSYTHLTLPTIYSV